MKKQDIRAEEIRKAEAGSQVVRSQKVISSMKNNDSVSKNNEVGIFRALQSRMVQLE